MHQMNTNGSRFLFDIHGTQESDADIYFGTDAKNCEGSTICGLLGLNPNALWDDTGLIKLLKDRGYKTCPNEPGDEKLSKLDGGTTVRNYGGCNVSQRVEAIQCEIAPRFRNEHDLPQLENSQGIWLNVYLSLFLVIFLKLNNLVIEPKFIYFRPLGADLIFQIDQSDLEFLVSPWEN